MSRGLVRAMTALLCVCVSACATTVAPPSDTAARTAARFEAVRDDPTQLDEFLESMPIGGDIHHHISGGLPPLTLISLAAEDGLCVPRDPEAVWALSPPPCGAGTRPAGDALGSTDLQHEIERRWSMLDYEADDPAIDRLKANDHFFSIFAKIRPLGREMARRLAATRALAAEEGVAYIETTTRWAPDRSPLRELEALAESGDIEELGRHLLADERFTGVRDAAVAGLAEEYARSDRILGCGGLNPDPGCDVVVRFQYLTIRTQPLPAVIVQALMAFEMARASSLVVGVNIAGPETHEISLRDYELHMEVLGALGEWYPEVPKSLHAAELTDRLATDVGADDHLALAIGSVEQGGAAARRVGHAVSLNVETDRTRILRQLAQDGIAVEMNLRSNELLLGVKGPEHPLKDYLAAGVPIVLATDDPGLMGTTLREQFRIAASFEEVDYLDLREFALDSVRYSFLPDGERAVLERQLLGEFEAFEQKMAGRESSLPGR